MRRHMSYIVLGALPSPEYGAHPGVPWLCVLVALGFVAGSDKGLLAGLFGVAFMAAFLLPVFLYGCWHSGRSLTKKRQG